MFAYSGFKTKGLWVVVVKLFSIQKRIYKKFKLIAIVSKFSGIAGKNTLNNTVKICRPTAIFVEISFVYTWRF